MVSFCSCEVSGGLFLTLVVSFVSCQLSGGLVFDFSGWFFAFFNFAQISRG